MTERQTCPACGASSLTSFYDESNIPTNSCLLMDSAEEASSFPRGDLALACCEACGFVFNQRFVAEQPEYSQRYEETQGFSGHFMSFAEDLAQRWVDRYDLANGTVLEIGCGKGEFLLELAKAGASHCIGIDPGVHPERIETPPGAQMEWIADFYGPEYGHIDADAVICRHTLEHIPDVADFMTNIRTAIGDRPDTAVLFELPDVRRVLDETAFWDIYYEHCSYFSLGSLARLFRATGFEVLDLSTEYDGQYLLIEARPSTIPAPGEPLDAEHDLDDIVRGVRDFKKRYDDLVTDWSTRLAEAKAAGETVVIWGSGSKGVSFISNLGITDEIAAAVDVNPHKHGKYMVGSPHKIIGPADLATLQPDLVVAMNPIYTAEIQADLDRHGVTAELTAL